MVCRSLLLTGLALAPLALTGCAGTWDTLTSRRFREQPLTSMQRMIVPEDPVDVLLTDPRREGDELAAAMRRLKEPIRDNRPQQDQDAIIELLGRTAANDPSPILRMEAIGALGRFEDVRANQLLVLAYQNAHGRKNTEPVPQKPTSDSGVIQAGTSAGRAPTRPNSSERFPITGPTGFPPEWVSSIRCRAAESLGRTGRPEAAKFLAAVAGGSGSDIHVEGSEDREVRLAAIRALGQCRQPESVAALAQVLKSEADKHDTAVMGRTHEGLVRLTGKRLPPDPQQWGEVIQAGVVLAPEPTWWDKTVEQASYLVK